MNPYQLSTDLLFFEPREYKASSKSEEEISALMFDPETPDHLRFEKNIKSNSLEQKLSVYLKINQILQNETNYQRIFPIIREQLNTIF